MKKIINLDSTHYGLRLDLALAKLLPDVSRSQIQALITNNNILVDNHIKSSKYKCKGKERIEINFTDSVSVEDQPQDIPLDIVYEDSYLIVINKQPGLTVHPGAGQKAKTLLNSLLFHRPQLKSLTRAGIVHRLDKDTSGLMVIAKTQSVRLYLIDQLAKKLVSREYLALTEGSIDNNGVINAPIIRHPINRTQMTVARDHHIKNSKSALTFFKVIKHYQTKHKIYNLVHCRLHSGRTHQVRVHLNYIKAPIIGDKKYNYNQVCQKLGRILSRQMLHAFYLRLIHPHLKHEMSWQVEIPEDFQRVINTIKESSNVS